MRAGWVGCGRGAQGASGDGVGDDAVFGTGGGGGGEGFGIDEENQRFLFGGMAIDAAFGDDGNSCAGGGQIQAEAAFVNLRFLASAARVERMRRAMPRLSFIGG